MFVLRSEQVISPGRNEDYAAYQEQSMGAARQQPGFLWEVRLVYLGNFARRLVYQGWETREARLAYSRGERWVRAPSGLLAGPAVTGYYDLLIEAQDSPPSAGHYVVDRHFRVSNGVQDEFEALEAGLCGLAKGQEGFVARSALKFLGNDTSYVRMSIWESWADLESWVQTPAYASENEAILNRVVWTTADRYEIVTAAFASPVKEKPLRVAREALPV